MRLEYLKYTGLKKQDKPNKTETEPSAYAMTVQVHVTGSDRPTPERIEEYIKAGIKSSEGKEPWRVHFVTVQHSQYEDVMTTLVEFWNEMVDKANLLDALVKLGLPIPKRSYLPEEGSTAEPPRDPPTSWTDPDTDNIESMRGKVDPDTDNIESMRGKVDHRTFLEWYRHACPACRERELRHERSQVTWEDVTGAIKYMLAVLGTADMEGHTACGCSPVIADVSLLSLVHAAHDWLRGCLQLCRSCSNACDHRREAYAGPEPEHKPR